jgi:AcrR family transcriptional regulator
MPRKTSRDDIVAAATATFHEHGYHAARISDIVAAAGVSQGTFYLYFPSKLDAFLAVIQALADQIRDLALSIEWSSIATVADYRHEFSVRYGLAFELLAQHREAAALLMEHAPAVGDDAAAIYRGLLDDLEAITTRYLAIGTEQGVLRDFDVPVVARAIVGLLVETVAHTVIKERRSHDLQQLADELLDFELYGVVARE